MNDRKHKSNIAPAFSKWRYNFEISNLFFITVPLWKKWGYTGFGLLFIVRFSDNSTMCSRNWKTHKKCVTMFTLHIKWHVTIFEWNGIFKINELIVWWFEWAFAYFYGLLICIVHFALFMCFVQPCVIIIVPPQTVFVADILFSHCVFIHQSVPLAVTFFLLISRSVIVRISSNLANIFTPTRPLNIFNKSKG